MLWVIPIGVVPGGHGVPSGTDMGLDAGQAANAQFGPVRSTAEPSGQSFASSVQAMGLGVGLGICGIAGQFNAR